MLAKRLCIAPPTCPISFSNNVECSGEAKTGEEIRVVLGAVTEVT